MLEGKGKILSILMEDASNANGKEKKRSKLAYMNDNTKMRESCSFG